MCRGGTNVRYIRSTFVTGDGRCMCLFDAPSEGAVRRLNNDANIPYERVIEALDLSPAPTEAGDDNPPLGLAVCRTGRECGRTG